jgi:hypothetical protein
MITYSTIDPGKSLTFVQTFAPGAPSGEGKPNATLEPGTYTATGILALAGRAPRPMASATFTVK